MFADHVHPAGTHRRSLLLWVGSLDKGHACRKRAGAPQSQNCGKQTDSYQHGNSHCSRSTQRHGGHARNIDNHQCHQCNNHRQPSEHYGCARLTHGQARQMRALVSGNAAQTLCQFLRSQVMAVHVLDQLAAETRQNKQRIINAHSQADHHGQGCGVLIDAVRQARRRVNAQRAKHYAHNRRGQRHSRRHQRSERDQQHHGRHENTHQLALHARLLCAVKCVARVGNVKAIRVVFQQFSNVRYLIFINILHFRCIKHHLDNPRCLIRTQW